MSDVCPWCGEEHLVEIFEVWDDGSFMLQACCEGADEEARAILAALDPQERAEALAALNDGLLTALRPQMGKLRRCVDDDMGGMLLDWNPRLAPVSFREARAFIQEHHRHNPHLTGWRFGASIWNGAQMIGVVSVGRPVARALDATSVVEVNRLAMNHSLPQDLMWNACSMAYGWAAKEAKRRGFQKIITYLRADEPGVSIRAAGWVAEAEVRGRSWSSPSRPREDKMTPIGKVRWARQLTASRRDR